MPLRASFRSFGCKLNQAETDAMAAAFSNAGAKVVPSGEPAELLVFNTCTVTGKAEQKARRELRLALRNFPDAFAIVTGCYAELEPGAVAEISPRILVVPGSRKDVVAALADGLASAWHDRVDLADEARRLVARSYGAAPDPFGYQAARFAPPASGDSPTGISGAAVGSLGAGSGGGLDGGAVGGGKGGGKGGSQARPGLGRTGEAMFRSRAQLKIQDGCDNSCSYCRVCLARGPSVSLGSGEVLSRVRALEAAGVPEIVLTGVNLSQYRSEGLDFPGLLGLLARGSSRVAFRISSYEPDEVDSGFIDAFSSPRVRPHLHLPAQSGSNRVLKAMRRRYGAQAIVDAVEAARAARGDPFIGFDLILGFPGESDEDFSDTMALIERARPSGIHAFTYSPRPGTAAAKLRPKVPERVAVERAAAVAEASRRGRATFAARRIGAELEAIVDLANDDDDEGTGGSRRLGPTSAVSAEYLRLELRGAPPGVSGAVRCLAIRESDPGGKLGGADLVAEYLGLADSG